MRISVVGELFLENAAATNESNGQRDGESRVTGIYFPVDLRSWLAPAELWQAAQGSAQHSIHRVHPVFSFQSAQMIHPWRMLSLVAFSYAGGVFASQRVEEMARHDPMLRFFFGAAMPRAELVRRFRKYNRAAVLRCLEMLLLTAWRQHARSGAGWGPEAECGLPENIGTCGSVGVSAATSSASAARAYFFAEASHRIECAEDEDGAEEARTARC